MVKIEGTLDELRELMGDTRRVVRRTRALGKKVAKEAPKVKRKLSAWQRYIKNTRNHIKFKSGEKKGRLNLKAMSKAFKKKQKRK